MKRWPAICLLVCLCGCSESRPKGVSPVALLLTLAFCEWEIKPAPKPAVTNLGSFTAITNGAKQMKAVMDSLPTQARDLLFRPETPPRISWMGHPNLMYTNYAGSWPGFLTSHEIGFREDGVVVWRAVK